MKTLRKIYNRGLDGVQCYDALDSAMNAYTTATFKAAQTASLGYLDAAIKELVDNAKDAKNIYEREKNYYADKVNTLETMYGNSSIMVYAAQATIAHNDALLYKAGVNVKSEITAKEAANKVVRVASDLVTAATYKVAENVAWGTYVINTTIAEVTYLAKYVQTETTFNATKKAADELYMETVTPAWTEYTKQIRDWTTILFAAIRMANDPGFALSTLFSLGLSALQGNYHVVMLGQGGDGTQGGGNSQQPPGISKSIDFEAEAKLFGIKESVANMTSMAKTFSFLVPVPGLSQSLDNGDMAVQMALDTVIIGRRQVEQNGVSVKSAYTTLAMPLANLAGVTGASYFVDGTDPVSGRELGMVERGVQGVFGSIQLVGTAVGIRIAGGSAVSSYAVRPSLTNPANTTAIIDNGFFFDVGAGIPKVPTTTATVGATYNPALVTTGDVAMSFNMNTFAGVRDASQYLRDLGVARNYRVKILQSFEPETIKLQTASGSEYGLRFYDNIDAFARGRYLFRTFPASRESLAISSEWNQMSEIIQWQIKPGTTMITGRAASQGAGLSGGQIQIFIIETNDLIFPIQPIIP